MCTEPVAPDGDWFKDFGSFKLAGHGEKPSTFLTDDMVPYGKQIK